MAVYRVTRFAGSDMDKAVGVAESMRDVLEGLGADLIDIASDGEGNGIVIARYPDKAAMDAATPIAKQAFGKMIEDGAVDEGSIEPWIGDVIMSL